MKKVTNTVTKSNQSLTIYNSKVTMIYRYLTLLLVTGGINITPNSSEDKASVLLKTYLSMK